MPVVASAMPFTRGRSPPAVVELEVCAGAIIQPRAGQGNGQARMMQVAGPDGGHFVTVMGQGQEAFAAPQVTALSI